MKRKILKFKSIGDNPMNLKVYTKYDNCYLFSTEDYTLTYYFKNNKEIKEAIKFFVNKSINHRHNIIDLSSFKIETVNIDKCYV